VGKHVLEHIGLFLLLLHTLIEQGKVGDLGNRPIAWLREGARRYALEIGLCTFAIQIVQDIHQLLANKGEALRLRAIFGDQRPIGNLIDIALQPDAQPSLQAERSQFWGLHQQMAQVVEQTKVIDIFGRGHLINLARVAPGALIQQGGIRGRSGITLGNHEPTHSSEQVGMGLISRIEEMHSALGDSESCPLLRKYTCPTMGVVVVLAVLFLSSSWFAMQLPLMCRKGV
jgi:hypothetical protein